MGAQVKCCFFAGLSRFHFVGRTQAAAGEALWPAKKKAGVLSQQETFNLYATTLGGTIEKNAI